MRIGQWPAGSAARRRRTRLPRHRLQRCRGPCMQSHNCDILRSPPEMGEGRGCPKNGPEHYVHLGRRPVRRTPARPMTLCQPTPPAHPTWASEQDWSPKNVWGFFGTGRRKTSGGFCAVAPPPRTKKTARSRSSEPPCDCRCYYSKASTSITMPTPGIALPCQCHARRYPAGTMPLPHGAVRDRDSA